MGGGGALRLGGGGGADDAFVCGGGGSLTNPFQTVLFFVDLILIHPSLC